MNQTVMNVQSFGGRQQYARARKTCCSSECWIRVWAIIWLGFPVLTLLVALHPFYLTFIPVIWAAFLMSLVKATKFKTIVSISLGLFAVLIASVIGMVVYVNHYTADLERVFPTITDEMVTDCMHGRPVPVGKCSWLEIKELLSGKAITEFLPPAAIPNPAKFPGVSAYAIPEEHFEGQMQKYQYCSDYFAKYPDFEGKLLKQNDGFAKVEVNQAQFDEAINRLMLPWDSHKKVRLEECHKFFKKAPQIEDGIRTQLETKRYSLELYLNIWKWELISVTVAIFFTVIPVVIFIVRKYKEKVKRTEAEVPMQVCVFDNVTVKKTVVKA